MDENSKKLRIYLSTVKKALICYECKKICTEPWVIRCGHNFCKTCIQNLRNLNRNCPRCDLQPITRRGVIKNDELEKVINQFYKLEDAFKADTQLNITQDRLVPAPISYDSKNLEQNIPKTPLNNVGPTSGQDSKIAPGRKNSIPETEYFRRFKSSTFRKIRVDSDESPTMGEERNFAEDENLPDEEVDGFLSSHIICESKNFEHSHPKTSLNNVGPKSVQASRTRPERKSSVPETEYFRRFKNLTFKKNRIDSDKSPTRDENYSEVESLRDEAESLEEQNEEEQSLVDEESRTQSSHESDLLESDENLEEQNEEEESLTSEENQRLLSHESDLFESDESLEKQNEEEQSLIYEENLRFSSHESDLLESDGSLEERNEKEQSLIDGENQRLSRHESDPFESDKSLGEQNEEEQSLIDKKSITLSSYESDESFEKRNEEEQSLISEENLRLSSHEFDLLESDESLEEQNEEEESLIYEENLRFSSHESDLLESDESLEEQNEEEQSLIYEENLRLSSHEYDLLESDVSFEEKNVNEQSLIDGENLSPGFSSHESEVFESDEDQEGEEDDEYPDSPIKSLISTSEISDEIESYDVEEISTEMEISSDTELQAEEMVLIPLVFPFAEMDQTVSQSNTETESLEESIFFLKPFSAIAAKESSNSIDSIDLDSPSACESPENIHTTNLNHTLNLASPPAFDSQNVHRTFLRKGKSPDDVFKYSGRNKHIPFSKAARKNKIRKKVLFHYCGKLSRHYKSLVDKDIVTVLSPDEIKSNLAKKSPMNRNLFDFGFKILKGNLNPDTSKVNGTSLLGKRKRSVSKAKNFIEYFEGDTTENLSDFRNKSENNLDKKRRFGTSRNVSIISESELTTESFSVRQMRAANEKAEEKLKMLEFPSASGTDSLQDKPQFLNLDFKQENIVEKINQLKSELLAYSPTINQIVPQKHLSRIEDLEERPIERIRASVEDDDICESFHIEKFFAFRKESQDECTFEDEGDNRVDGQSILLADGSRTPKRSSFIRSRDISLNIFEKKCKPSGGIIVNKSEVIILSSDDEDSSKKQEYLAPQVKQEPLTPVEELNSKIKSTRRVPHADHTFGWGVKKKIAKE